MGNIIAATRIPSCIANYPCDVAFESLIQVFLKVLAAALFKSFQPIPKVAWLAIGVISLVIEPRFLTKGGIEVG